MSSIEQRPNVERILAGLKDFQRQSVEYVYQRLYEDPDKVNRFLIADEVGLGKTLVARGLIAKAVDQLWDQVQRIDIIYICANQDIARQNVNRLNITPDRELTIATRMTFRLPVTGTGCLLNLEMIWAVSPPKT
jgi:superfamily II DNA or RNA helicase